MAHAVRAVHSARPIDSLGYLRRRRLVGGSLATLAARPARAQQPWPTRPVRLLVGQPPGTGGDLLARGLAPHFAAAFGQDFVVENRPGAGGTVAAALVAQSRDGHTIGVVLGGPTTTARALNPELSYDPARDFAAITLLTRVPFILAVPPSLGVRDVEAFLALVRANPGRFAYASVGPGTVTHLAMEELRDRLGLDIRHVPYRGFPQATLDLLAGRVHAMFNVPLSALPHLADGSLVALAQSGEARMATLPDVPTLEEAGHAGSSFFGWTGLVAAAGFPGQAASRLAAVARRALREDPAARGGLDRLGNELLGSDPWELALLQMSEAMRWKSVIERLGLRATD
jgi:tripartite-type tricarboxylate transporter receptor subunit TctC